MQHPVQSPLQRAHGSLARRLHALCEFRFCLVHRRQLFAAEPRPAPEGFELVEATEPQLLEACQDAALELTPAFVARALRRGDRCFAAVEAGRIAAYCWVSTSGAVPVADGLEFEFDGRSGAYGYKMLTHPRYRGQRLQQHVVARVDAALLERGSSYVVGYIDAHNYPQRKNMARIPGLTLVGFAGTLSMFGRVATFRSLGAMRFGAGFRAAERQAARGVVAVRSARTGQR